ncbi:MAG: hypothetical protein IT435_04560 [Phycisphaerales bacterium]|nr:hypothetical protein [Phycisphaerales bacterium]
MELAKTWCVVGVSVLSAAALASDPRNHEPYNLLVPNKTLAKVALCSSVIGHIVDEDFLPFSHYGITGGTPSEAINVVRQIWVTDTSNRKIYRFAADIFYPPPYYGEVLTGPVDQIRGMEFVKQNHTIYVAHSGTNLSAPGDRILMFDVTGQPVGSFAATNPTDIMYSPELNELLITNATHEAIDRYTLEGQFLGRLIDSDGVSSIDRPMQMSRNHHSGELLVAGADSPAGLYHFDLDGEEMGFYPQVGHPEGMAELDYDLKHGFWLFTSEFGMFTYWSDGDELDMVRDNGAWGFINTVQFFCWADYDRSDFVDLDDYVAFVYDFEAGLPLADFDGSGFVDFEDFFLFVERFVAGC